MTVHREAFWSHSFVKEVDGQLIRDFFVDPVMMLRSKNLETAYLILAYSSRGEVIHRQDISCLACILTSSAPSFLHLAKRLCHKHLTNTPHFLTDLHKAHHISCPIRHYQASSISHAHIFRHHVRRLGYRNQDWEQDQRRLLSA